MSRARDLASNFTALDALASDATALGATPYQAGVMAMAHAQPAAALESYAMAAFITP